MKGKGKSRSARDVEVDERGMRPSVERPWQVSSRGTRQGANEGEDTSGSSAHRQEKKKKERYEGDGGREDDDPPAAD